MSSPLSRFEALDARSRPNRIRRGRAIENPDKVHKIYEPRTGWEEPPPKLTTEQFKLLTKEEKNDRRKRLERCSKQKYAYENSLLVLGQPIAPRGPKDGSPRPLSRNTLAERGEDATYRRTRVTSEKFLEQLKKIHPEPHDVIKYYRRSQPAIIYYLGVHINVTPLPVARKAPRECATEETEDTDFWSSGSEEDLDFM